tara:strand:+ start:1218 stop:1496 length:279 start_codon:yes stop_codon:yes gene_type:complete
MKVDKELIEKIGRISRIKLSKEEINKFIQEFKGVLKLFSKIDKVKVEDKIINELSVKNKFREDITEPCLNEKEIFSNTKNKEKSFFKGPKIK